ncbi:hypothetical protein V2J09_010317 [Rumex salicifolius]
MIILGDYGEHFLGKDKYSVGNYNIDQKILLVGEGDFSFASSLASSFRSASNITATSLDSREAVIRKYSNGKKNLLELEDVGALVLHQIDAHSLDEHPRLRHKLFDRIVFNFPHAGGVYGSCNETVSWYIDCHRRVVSGFLEEAKNKLTSDGEVHVTHKTCHPFNKWNIVELAEDAGLMLTREAKFERSDYPGYMNKRGYGSKWNKTFRVGECSTFMFSPTWGSF